MYCSSISAGCCDCAEVNRSPGRGHRALGLADFGIFGVVVRSRFGVAVRSLFGQASRWDGEVEVGWECTSR